MFKSLFLICIFSQNFVAGTKEAKSYIPFCEELRTKLAQDWLGYVPIWNRPCILEVELLKDGTKHKGGSASNYTRIRVVGSDKDLKEILLPHEIMHTITYTYYRRYPPPWINEGISVVCESNKKYKPGSYIFPNLKSITYPQLNSFSDDKKRAFYYFSGEEVKKLLGKKPLIRSVKW